MPGLALVLNLAWTCESRLVGWLARPDLGSQPEPETDPQTCDDDQPAFVDLPPIRYRSFSEGGPGFHLDDHPAFDTDPGLEGGLRSGMVVSNL